MPSSLSRAAFVLMLAWLASIPTGTSPQTISRVREVARAGPGLRVVVRGTVTRARAGRSLYIQDQTGSIFVSTEGTSPVAPGDLVEVTGVADVDEYAPFIATATYQRLGPAEAPVPIDVSARELALGKHDAELVVVHGIFTGPVAGRNDDGLSIRADGVEFGAWLPREAGGRPATLRPGSEVRVTGVASTKVTRGRISGFELLMRTTQDALILHEASWWTVRRVSTAAVALAGVAALLFSYVVLLRREVRHQTGVIREQLRQEAALQEQYRQAQKMEAVGRLAGGIAHDFNNIMTVVLGHSELLAVELAGHPEMITSVDEIRRAAERAAALTGQLLAFGRRQTLQTARVDLHEVASGMVSLLGRVLGGDIDVRAEAPAAPVIIVADRAQLEQALLNLAVNARDAMPDGGRLVLAVARRESADGRTSAVMTVADSGAGIPLEAQPHIFDPFYTTKEVGRGSGLGLAMVYGFVQQSGGAIAFDTTLGVGTTFTLTFPLAPSAGGPGPGGC